MILLAPELLSLIPSTEEVLQHPVCVLQEESEWLYKATQLGKGRAGIQSWLLEAGPVFSLPCLFYNHPYLLHSGVPCSLALDFSSCVHLISCAPDCQITYRVKLFPTALGIHHSGGLIALQNTSTMAFVATSNQLTKSTLHQFLFPFLFFFQGHWSWLFIPLFSLSLFSSYNIIS
jgi:hypothetical protein